MAQDPHHSLIMEELGNANTIHAFNRFEEKGHVDLARDALYALGTPTSQD